jgi:pimeloyl-ACP methyl ester carboxylesterase
MQPDSSGYVSANGVDYWFEIHGTGEPLLLLHGGLFSTGMFGPTRAPARSRLHPVRAQRIPPRDASPAGRRGRGDGKHDEGLADVHTSYTAIAPHPEDFPRLLDNMGDFMRRDYDWSANVKSLKLPVMLVYGDADMFRPEHVISFYQLLGGGLRDAGWVREHMSKNRLAIVPDRTHYELGASPVLAPVVLPFLNGETHGS